MHLERTAYGDVTCAVRNCRWREHVQVNGGDAELQQEQQERRERHQREQHSWMFLEFCAWPDPVTGLAQCGCCGAAVTDQARHRQWHQTAAM